MDLRQLEAFVNVVKFKSFSAAAKALYLSQPTISAHIVSLEDELSTKLLVRTTREVYPTKVGQLLFTYALKMLSLREDAINAVQNFENSKDGEILISASSVPANYFLDKIISAYEVKNPKASFKITEKDSIGVINDIDAQNTEIGFVGTTAPNVKCDFVPFTEDRLVIIAPNTLYYKTKFSDGYSIQKLLKEPFVTRKKGSGTRKEAEYLLKEAGMDLSKINIVKELDNSNEVITEVCNGAGLAVISSFSAENSQLRSKFLIFPIENITRTRKFYIVKHKLNPLSPLAEDFYNFSLKFYQYNNKFLY